MFSWSIEANCQTEAAEDEIWKLWTDVSGWPKWDKGLEWCRLDGPFAIGTKGSLKPAGSPALPFELTDVIPGRSYEDLTCLPFTRLTFTHTLIKLPDGKVQIRHQASCKGLLAPILFLTLRRDLKKGMPQSIRKLAEMAEKGRN